MFPTILRSMKSQNAFVFVSSGEFTGRKSKNLDKIPLTYYSFQLKCLYREVAYTVDWYLTQKKSIDHFKKTIEKSKQRLHCISHNGFHRDGLKPETAMKLYKLMVRLILEYGGQALTYLKYFLKSSIYIPKSMNKPTVFEEKLEPLRTQALETLIGCPKSTSPSIVRFFPASNH